MSNESISFVLFFSEATEELKKKIKNHKALYFMQRFAKSVLNVSSSCDESNSISEEDFENEEFRFPSLRYEEYITKFKEYNVESIITEQVDFDHEIFKKDFIVIGCVGISLLKNNYDNSNELRFLCDILSSDSKAYYKPFYFNGFNDERDDIIIDMIIDNKKISLLKSLSHNSFFEIVNKISY